MAGQLAVNQEGALDVPIGAYQLLKLLGGEGVRQVGEAEQGVGGLQGDVDQASTDSAVVEGADGILSLVPVQQSHKGWRRGQYGDGDERKRRTRTGTDSERERCVDINGRGGGRVMDERGRTVKADTQKTGRRQLMQSGDAHTQKNAKGKSGGKPNQKKNKKI